METQLLIKQKEDLEREFSEKREKLLNHTLYNNIKTLEHVKKFMSVHVYAVWDFMSLLVRLQKEITSVKIPWENKPKTSRFVRMINEIKTCEESDESLITGEYISHFDMYCKAMTDLDVDIPVIPTVTLINYYSKFITYEQLSKDNPKIAKPILDFILFNLNLAHNGLIENVISAFTYGREDLIPEMFDKLLPSLESVVDDEDKLKWLKYYVKRHIEIDGDTHGPMMVEMLKYYCNDDIYKTIRSLKTAIKSLELRIKLWDYVDSIL